VAALLLSAACRKKEQPPPKPKEDAPAASTADAPSPWHIELKIAPDHPSMTKPVTFIVHIVDGNGRPVDHAQVSGSLTTKMMDMGTTKVPLASKGNGDYEGSLKSMDMSGPWNQAVDASLGSFHALKDFQIVIYD
jgi:hypothetical protein